MKCLETDLFKKSNTSKIDNWIYIDPLQPYSNITNKQKDKHSKEQARNSIISWNVYKKNKNYIVASWPFQHWWYKGKIC